MTRTIVVRTCQPSFGTTTLASKNVNDEIGLAPFLSYTVAEHLEDLASDGLTVVSAEGNSYRFSDGSAFRLEQRVVSVSESRLDLETLRLVTIAKIVDRRREITQAIGA